MIPFVWTLALTLLLPFELLAQRQVGDLLDLTKDIPPQKERVSGGSGGGPILIGSTIKKEVPLRITLLHFDKLAYRLGEQIVYEVRLENVSNHDLTLPWSLDLDKVKPDEKKDPPGYLTSSLSLVFNDPIYGIEFVGLASLYGSQLVPDSLKVLRPNERVRIRAARTFFFGDARISDRVIRELPIRLDLSAYFNLQDRPFDPTYDSSFSQNCINVQLEK